MLTYFKNESERFNCQVVENTEIGWCAKWSAAALQIFCSGQMDESFAYSNKKYLNDEEFQKLFKKTRSYSQVLIKILKWIISWIIWL